MTKRLLSLWLVFGIAFSFFMPSAAQSESEGAQGTTVDYAEIVFEPTPETHNIEKCFFSEKDVKKQVTVGGENAIRLNRSAGCYYLMLDLDDEVFPKSEKEQSVTVTVEYYDEGYGLFTLRYDSVKNSVANVCEDHVDVVKLQDSKAWKTHTFYVDDAAFGGTLNGSDFIVALWSTRTGSISPEDLIVHSVRVERAFPQKPVTINLRSEEYGNIFKKDDHKAMQLHFDNITDTDIAVDLRYRILDEENNTYETGEIKKTVTPGAEDQTFPIETGVSEYGLYYVLLEGKLEYVFGGKTHFKEINQKLNFSVVNKFLPGEEKNPDFGVCTHMGQTAKRIPAMTAKIVAEAGIGFVRDEERWQNVEPQRGSYDFSGLFEYPHEVKKNGSGMLFIAAFGNTQYDSSEGNSGGMPNSKEDMEAFGRYVLAAIAASDGAINAVEIWNEPNYYDVFNPLRRTPEVYAELLKTVYPMIKKEYPDMPVVGCSCAGMGLDWIQGVCDAGGYDYMDAISVHPYDWGGSFRITNYIRNMSELKELMRTYGDMKEVWLTEMGWATSAVTPEAQAIYMVQVFAISKAFDCADKIVMYEFQDTGTDALDSEHNYGMIHYWDNSSTVMNTLITGGAGKDVRFEDVSTPWSAKPSYLSITAMNRLIGSAPYADTVEINSAVRAYRFLRKDGKSVLILWADGEPQNVSLKLDAKEIEEFDIYSNSLGVLKSEDGVFNITVQKEPSYIVGSFTAATVTEPTVTAGGVRTDWAKNDTLCFRFEDSLGRDMRIEVEAANVFEVVENNGIKAGNGSVSIKGTPEGDRLDYLVKFRLYDGDALCYTETKNVHFVDPVSVSVDKIHRLPSLDRWIMNVTVKNNSTTVTHSGGVSIAAPEELKEFGNHPYFTGLRPGETVTVPINLPRTVKQRLTSADIEVRLESGETRITPVEVSFADAKYAEKKPVIDGTVNGSEWRGVWINVDRKEDIGSTGFRGWAGEKDCSFSYNLMWDEDYLYLCVVAKDDLFSQNYTGYGMWQGDSIQIGLTEGNPQTLLDTSFNELGFALTSAGSEAYRYSSYSGQPGGTIRDIKLRISKTEGAVYYEAALPWSEAMSADYKPAEGNELAFSVLFNDNDGSGRRGWLEYTDGIGARKNASLFDGINLIK